MLPFFFLEVGRDVTVIVAAVMLFVPLQHIYRAVVSHHVWNLRQAFVYFEWSAWHNISVLSGGSKAISYNPFRHELWCNCLQMCQSA